MAHPTENEPDRIDYGEDKNLDDVVVENVTTFRMEWMDDNCVWLRCYRDGKPDVVFWLNARGRISGRHEYD
jgi:hypothetical protein